MHTRTFRIVAADLIGLHTRAWLTTGMTEGERNEGAYFEIFQKRLRIHFYWNYYVVFISLVSPLLLFLARRLACPIS